MNFLMDLLILISTFALLVAISLFYWIRIALAKYAKVWDVPSMDFLILILYQLVFRTMNKVKNISAATCRSLETMALEMQRMPDKIAELHCITTIPTRMSWLSSLWIAILLYGVLKLTRAWVNYLHLKRTTAKCPQLDVPLLIGYLVSFRRIQWKERPTSVACYVLEALCAICKIFEKEKICAIWMLFRPAIMLFKPESVEAVLNSHSVIEKSSEYRFLHPWLGTGLLTSSGQKWRHRRKLLTPSFHFRILEDFISIFNSQSEVLIDKLKSVSHKESVDIVPHVTMCTLDIICESTMGVTINAQNDPESEYVRSIYEISELFWYRITRPWFWSDTLFRLSSSGRRMNQNIQVVHNFTRKVIKMKKEVLLRFIREGVPEVGQNDSVPKREKKAFLELLLELHIKDSSFTEEDIREEVDTFMFEGHDTTAMAISWTLYNVGLHPDIQMKIHSEMDEIFGDDRQREVTIEDIKEMKYLDCVIKESLRLYPSVPIIGREVTESIDILGYTISPGCLLAVFPFMLHRDPISFPNPEVFDPDRFSPDNSVGRNPFAYIPFSAGPRNCIGQRFAVMEEKTVLANVFRTFEVKSLDPRDKINVMGDLILRCDGPLRLKLNPRS